MGSIPSRQPDLLELVQARSGVAEIERKLKISPQEQRIVDYHRNSIATGNVGRDPEGRPITVYSLGVLVPEGPFAGKFASIPGWVDGRILSEREAWERWKEEINAGQWPLYNSGEELNARARDIHEIMDMEEQEAVQARDGSGSLVDILKRLLGL